MTDKTVPVEYVNPVLEWVGPPLDTHGSLPSEPAPSRFTAGYPDTLTGDGDTRTFSWEAEFTPEQEDEWALFVKKARRRMEPPDEAEMQPHFDTMRAYYQAASPTQAQTVQALKAAIAVIREMWKE